MKIIEFAFLCASAVPNSRGGMEISHLHDNFRMSDLAGLSLVFRFDVEMENLSVPKPYTLFGDVLLSLEVESQADEEIKTYPLETIITQNICAVPIGKLFDQPGAYTLRLRADGAPQSTLLLFLT